MLLDRGHASLSGKSCRTAANERVSKQEGLDQKQGGVK